MTRTRLGVAATALLLTLPGLASCGSGDEPAVPAAATSATSAPSEPVGAARRTATYPVTVENCGRDVTFTEAPQRIVSGWITGTELLLELGQQDRIVGIYNTSSFGVPRSEYAAAYDELAVLSEAAPSKEALLAAEPDLIYADGNYLFDGTQLPTVEELARSGTNVLVLSGFCDDGGASAVLDVEEDLAALGPALDVPDAAAEVAAEVDQRLSAVAPVPGGAPVTVLSSFDGTVYAYEGVYTDILERAGASNAYAGTLPSGTFFGEVSIEDVTQKNPATMLYLLSGDESPEAAKGYLDQTFPTVDAVNAGRVVYLPQEDSSNLRGVDGVEQVASELRSLG